MMQWVQRIVLLVALVVAIVGLVLAFSNNSALSVTKISLATTQGDLTTERQNLVKTQGDLDAATQRVATLEKQSKAAQAAQAAMEEARATFQGALDRLSNGQTSLKETLAAAQADLSRTTLGLAAAISDVGSLKTNVRRAQDDAATVKRDLTTQKLGLSDLKDSFLLTRDQATTNAESISKLQTDVADVTAANQALQAKMGAASKYAAVSNAWLRFSTTALQFDIGEATKSQLESDFETVDTTVGLTGDGELQAAWRAWLTEPSGSAERDRKLAAYWSLMAQKLADALE